MTKRISKNQIIKILDEAKIHVKLWMDEYNNERSHNRLDGLTPMQYEMSYMENV